MNQPLNLSNYLTLFRKRWKLMALPLVVALVTAGIVSAFMPVRYTARATLIAPRPYLTWRWDAKISDVVDTRLDWRAEVLPLLTTTDLAERALAQVGDQLTAPVDAETLIDDTNTHIGSGSLFDLSVRAATAEDALLLTNAMAHALPAAVADYFGGSQEANAQALAEVQSRYDTLDAALRDFRGRTGMGLGMSGALAARGDELFGVESEIRQELTLKNSYRAALKTLLDRIDMVLAVGAESPNQLPYTLLNLPELSNTYGLTYGRVTDLAAKNPAALLDTLRQIRTAAAADLDRTTQDAMAIQNELSSYLQEWENLLQERGVWLESVSALERRDIELQMKQLIEGPRVSVVDEAVLPTRPSQPNWLLNLGAAGIAGLLLGVFLAAVSVYLSPQFQQQVGQGESGKSAATTAEAIA